MDNVMALMLSSGLSVYVHLYRHVTERLVILLFGDGTVLEERIQQLFLLEVECLFLSFVFSLPKMFCE